MSQMSFLYTETLIYHMFKPVMICSVFEWQKLPKLWCFCLMSAYWEVLSYLYLDICSHLTGAALVLNSVYTVIREVESIVSEFWLELLYHMVINLSLSEETGSVLGSQEQIVTALNHIGRVLKEKASLFNKVNVKTIYF